MDAVSASAPSHRVVASGLHARVRRRVTNAIVANETGGQLPPGSGSMVCPATGTFSWMSMPANLRASRASGTGRSASDRDGRVLGTRARGAVGTGRPVRVDRDSSTMHFGVPPERRGGAGFGQTGRHRFAALRTLPDALYTRCPSFAGFARQLSANAALAHPARGARRHLACAHRGAAPHPGRSSTGPRP